MPYSDMPPVHVERVVCSITAAIKYQVPANIMLAIAEKEGGSTGLENKNRNSNGSYDVGRMQFNTLYLKDLKKYGITAEDVAQPGCYSYDLAAWRIRGHIKNDRGDIWTKAANYHSRTPYYNEIYRRDLIRKAAKWQTWIEARFNTFDVTKITNTPQQPQLAAARVTPEEKAKSITQVANLAQTRADATKPPKNDGAAATPSTPDQLVGFAASVKRIPVKNVAKTDYQQSAQQLPLHYNKAAADALAAVYGNIKLR
ncbi:conjugal transfer protein [Salmonella enterica subsp. diarizonae]|uniref:Lytic transglycosylase n=1 Tax=Salmonella diarizonae TaxID=59204 RepID=A0A379XXA7_SALDZ|nr:conjugal transfer protein [Salmonella enterica]ECH9341663.1 conjugal transfer protein [Salmonella enterica subsp. diarizonae]EDU9903183.1 conjugal transfer protein [Salmonella enterica subsp. diarizonae]KAA8683474.1 conjugal transfer protein [Salmonella enterica subsp. diarizonae]SUI37501.1 lytic transglycosylase [Salmonella enterica subsp. diarizonae]VFS63628.1 lytic transglycosylase [Salmonella enterica subsp. diarizonae]